MKVSYGITVCNELDELRRLIDFLNAHTEHETDEIVILFDSTVMDDCGVKDYILDLSANISDYPMPIRVIYGELRDFTTSVPHFANFKNQLFKHCSGDYIFQLDADELPSEALISNLHELLTMNRQYDALLVPRVNTVRGITEEYVNKWNWRVYRLPHLIEVDEKASFSKGEYDLLFGYGLIREDSGDKIYFNPPIINYPDYQFRIYANNGNISWTGAVHERLVGYRNLGNIPSNQNEYYIMHPKDLERQIRQNSLYDTIH